MKIPTTIKEMQELTDALQKPKTVIKTKTLKPKGKKACENCGFEKPKVKVEVELKEKTTCKICDIEVNTLELKTHKTSIEHLQRKGLLDSIPTVSNEILQKLLVAIISK